MHHSPRFPLLALAAVFVLTWTLSSGLVGQTRQPTPIRQSTLTVETATTSPLTLRDASRNDRWLGLGVRDIRWDPNGSVVYFRWHADPQTDDVSEADPWYKADRDGRWVEQVTDRGEARSIPGANLEWSPNRRLAVWSSGSGVFLYESGQTRAIVTLGPRFNPPASTVMVRWISCRASRSTDT